MRNNLDFWRGTDFWSPLRLLDEDWHREFSPPVDIEETQNQYLLHFDLPGLSKKDIKIEVQDNQLLVSGERRYENKGAKSEEKAVHRTERFYGAFSRSFTLPTSVDFSRIEANYADGVLLVSVPKAETAKPRQIEIGEKVTKVAS